MSDTDTSHTCSLTCEQVCEPHISHTSQRTNSTDCHIPLGPSTAIMDPCLTDPLTFFRICFPPMDAHRLSKDKSNVPVDGG